MIMKTKLRKWATWFVSGAAILCLGCESFSEGGGRIGMTYESKHSVYLWNESDGDKQENSSKAGIRSSVVDSILEEANDDAPEPDGE